MSSRFDDIRPYKDEEINQAMRRLASNKYFEFVMKRFFPAESMEKMRALISEIYDIDTFQERIMHVVIRNIVNTTMTSFSTSGLEEIPVKDAFLFISNHRDILLDAALLQIALVESGHRTSGITFGSNLMQDQFGIDIGKSNKMFKVERSGTNAQIYNHSMHLSEYIRYSIVTEKESIWIAQRNGRTKDGADKTETGVIKMFSMSGSKNFVEDFAELNITPMSISYEYEPCDALKTQEIYKKELAGGYTKVPGEDYNSIVTGIFQSKGNVHIAISNPISREELEIISNYHIKNRIIELASLIDKKIDNAFRLWPTNYIAFDMINGTETYAGEYTMEKKEEFSGYVEKSIEKLEGERNRLREIFLTIYANPVMKRRE